MSQISVIVPVYNVELYLKRCIDSILAQTYDNIELILVDDGSPDGCGCICDEYLLMDSRVQVVHKQNDGLSSARNSGIDIAIGKYLAFVDSDDSVSSVMYNVMIEEAEKTHSDIVCCGRYDVYGTETKWGLCPKKNIVISPAEMINRMIIAKECDQSVCDKLFASHLWSGNRFPIGKINEDVCIMNQVVGIANQISLLNHSFYYYYHRRDSITTREFDKRTFDHTLAALSSLKYVENNKKECKYYAMAFLIRSIDYVGGCFLAANQKQQDENLSLFKIYVLDQIEEVMLRIKEICDADCKIFNGDDLTEDKQYCLDCYLTMLSNLSLHIEFYQRYEEIYIRIRRIMRYSLKMFSGVLSVSFKRYSTVYMMAYPIVKYLYIGYGALKRFIRKK